VRQEKGTNTTSAYLPIKLMVLVNHPVDSAVRTREYRKHVLYNNSKNNDGSGGGGGGAACELLHACKWIARKAGARSSAVYISLLCVHVLCTATQNIYDPPWPRAYFTRATAAVRRPSNEYPRVSRSSKDIDGTVLPPGTFRDNFTG